MLYLNKPIGLIRNLMIYADHADPNLFYYVPERPRLALNDGVPEFIFLKYKRDITDNPDFDPQTKQALGGGFLAFTVDLGVSDEILEQVRQELAQFSDGGEIKLTPVQFRKGSVRLTITKDAADAEDAASDEPRGLNFFEEVYGATKPSLFGFNRATFGLVLSAEAATLFEAALRSGISPVGVIYDLEFLGLRPAFNVKITADYRRIYEHLEMSFGARGQIAYVSLGIDIAAAFQKLRDDGTIKVEVIQFTDDDNLRKQADDAFNWFKNELLKDFFKSSMEPPSFMHPNSGGNMLSQLTSLLGPLTQNQSGSSNPQIGQPTTQIPTTANGPATMSDNSNSMSTVNRPSGNTPSGGSTGNTNNMSPFQVAFSLKFYKQEELKTRTFEYSQQSAVAMQAAPQGSFSTVVSGLNLNKAIREINLDDDFMRRIVTDVSLGSDFESSGLSLVGVNLEYPAQPQPGEQPLHIDGFLFQPGASDPRTFTSWLTEHKDLDYRYQMDLHFKPESPWVGKEQHITTGWITSRARQLTLNPLDVIDLLDVEITLGSINAELIEQVQVEMRYQDIVDDFEALRTFTLLPGSAGERWRLRLSNVAATTYSYRLNYFFKNGLRYSTAWQESSDPSLVVNDPFHGSINLRLVPQFDASEVMEAIIDVHYKETDNGYEHHEQIIYTADVPFRSKSIKIPTLSATPSSYSYELTVIRNDGSVFESEPIQTPAEDTVIVVTDGPGRTQRIKVQLASPDLTSSGLSALRVELIGVGSPPDRAEALFTASQTTPQVVTLLAPNDDQPLTYHYQVTGFTRQGLPLAGQSSDTSLFNLLVPLPTI